MKIKVVILFLLFATTMMAQELTVKSFALDETDLSARTNQVLDANGDPCALVKVGLVIPNAEFDGYIVKTVAKTSEYWVYFTDGSENIKVTAPGVLPLEYNFPEPLKMNCTYVLTLTVPENYIMPIPQTQTETEIEPENNVVVEEKQPEPEIANVVQNTVVSDYLPIFRIQPAYQIGSLTGVTAAIGLNFSGFDIELGGVKGMSKEEYFVYRSDGTEVGQSAFDAMALEGRLGYRIKAARGLFITPQVGASLLVVSDGLLVDKANAISGVAGVRVSYSLAKNFALFAAPSFGFKLSESDGYKQICEKADGLSKWSGGFNFKIGLSVEF
ncbi:MAG: autotransporter outer membrane beta-barrel domain-containing protein [Bacteroidaceae bacterium]|nr:autotransporter outer membrane beta-barrel domain-containing protein [Bacteroidaceae bacterium]